MSIKKTTLSRDEFDEHEDMYDGYCTACGEWTDGEVEPDATEYECPGCTAHSVFGAEEALLMGYVEIDDE